MRRFLILALSLSLVLSAFASSRLVAQDEKQDPAKAEQKPDAKTEPKTDEKADPAPKPDEPAKPAPAPAPVPAALKPVPPEVEAKLEAARRAVAEAIVAAQDAGLVDTTIEPPPILDILILGQANDKAVLKAKLDEIKANPSASPEAGLSVEVFGAWFSMQGTLEGVDLEKNIRIIQPSKGLTDWYRKRADIFNRHIAEARKAKGSPEPVPATTASGETPKEEAKPAEEPKADEPKKDDAKPEAPAEGEPKAV